MMSQELIQAPQNIPVEMNESDLPILSLRQSNFIVHLMAGDSLKNAYLNAGYDSEEHAGKAAWQLANNSPVKDHIEYHRRKLAQTITPEWIMDRYSKLINNSMDEDKPHLYDPDIAIKALQELTKIKGIYAPVNVNSNAVTLTGSIEDCRNAMLEYKKDR